MKRLYISCRFNGTVTTRIDVEDSATMVETANMIEQAVHTAALADITRMHVEDFELRFERIE